MEQGCHSSHIFGTHKQNTVFARLCDRGSHYKLLKTESLSGICGRDSLSRLNILNKLNFDY